MVLLGPPITLNAEWALRSAFFSARNDLAQWAANGDDGLGLAGLLERCRRQYDSGPYIACVVSFRPVFSPGAS
jgi:hypothetical protein